MRVFIVIIEESGYKEVKPDPGMPPTDLELEGDEFVILKKNKGGGKVEYEIVFDRGVTHFNSSGLFAGVE